MTVPGIAHKAEVSLNSIRSAGDPFWIFDDEHRALRFIESDPRPGGVLGPVYAGYMLPYTTGRETWIGALSWTPDWRARQRLADGLVDGRATRRAGARGRARARAPASCSSTAGRGCATSSADLRPLLEQVRRFGCASVYVLRERPDMARAAGPPDA